MRDHREHRHDSKRTPQAKARTLQLRALRRAKRSGLVLVLARAGR